ncbi:MAG: amidohydrolase family protein [Armatimonadetes bacterium]|nr:amidohydrolase family protein [Armatimonadota bacterium]
MADHFTAFAYGPQGWGVYEVVFEAAGPSMEPTTKAPERWLAPGFVDLHIHGAFGIDFMSCSSSGLAALCEKLAGVGYEAFLPTTVSASAEEVRRALSSWTNHPMLPGFHLEGPFISPQFPGAQPPGAIIDPPIPGSGWDDVLDDFRLRYVTLAPERPGAEALIRRLASRGVVVSMGHTNATALEANRGIAEGARHTTHTYNAMRPLHHREPGVLGVALTEGAVRCELIYDRLHVSKEAADLLLRAKGSEGVIAVSDGTAVSGLGDGHKAGMWGHDVETRNGGVYLAGSSTLAGSAITLLDAFRNLWEDFGAETAVRCCCLNPRLALPERSVPRVYVEFDRRKELVAIRSVAEP